MSRKRTNRIDTDVENFKEIVSKSYSITQVLKKLGYKVSGGNHTTVLCKINIYNIDISHFKGCGWNKGLTRSTDSRVDNISIKMEIPYEKVFCENSTYINRSKMLRKLLKYKNKEYKCEECGIKDWKNKHISMHLHHINKVPNDNRVENLSIICPNCHSQKHNKTFNVKPKNVKPKKIFLKSESLISKEELDSLCSYMLLKNISEQRNIPIATLKYLKRKYKIKNRVYSREHKRKFNPSKEELENFIKTFPTKKVAKMYGVSDKAIEKRCKIFGIDKPPRGYWTKLKYNKKLD